VLSYKAGGNGLDGGVDDGPSVHVAPFDYSSALLGMGSSAGLGTGPDDSFGAHRGSPITQTNDDGDGLTDEFEKLLGTDPTKADTDHDGLSDVQEVSQFHTDPLVANPAGQVDYLLAHPGSTAHDPARIPLAALQAGFGGGATLDSDHDGLSDLTEVQLGSDPYHADTDHDGVGDAVEHRLGSDLLHLDTDNDGIVDSVEYEQGTLGAAVGLPDPGTE
jgi:Bacterial TSP3 repeat